MTDRDLMFLVSVTILGGTLITWIVALVRGRGRKDD